MAVRILILLFIFLSLSRNYPLSAREMVIFSHHSGEIRIHDLRHQKEDVNSPSEEDLFPLLSRVSTGISLFTTSVLMATGYSEERLIADFGHHFHMEGASASPGQGIYAGEVLMLLGTLTASLFNYRFGFDNDVLAIIPILPIEVSASGAGNTYGMSEQQVRLQYGFYFYFSRDF